MLRERKPARTVLATPAKHSYNLSIQTAIKTHGHIAAKALFTECSSLLGKSTFHPVSRRDEIRNQELVLYEGEN